MEGYHVMPYEDGDKYRGAYARRGRGVRTPDLDACLPPIRPFHMSHRCGRVRPPIGHWTAEGKREGLGVVRLTLPPMV